MNDSNEDNEEAAADEGLAIHWDAINE